MLKNSDRCRALALLLATTSLGPLPAAAQDDLLGWRAARWGMSEADLEAAFGERLTRLPGRWQYGGAHAERALFDVRLGDLDFTAYFQMNDTTGRLQQVLLERRGPDAGPDGFRHLVAALEERYGPPAAACSLAGSPAVPLRARALWRFATTTIQAGIFDFNSTNLLYDDPNSDIDPLQPAFERRRINRRTLPRRIVLRFHPSARGDLISARRCPDEIG